MITPAKNNIAVRYYVSAASKHHCVFDRIAAGNKPYAIAEDVDAAIRIANLLNAEEFAKRALEQNPFMTNLELLRSQDRDVRQAMSNIGKVADYDDGH